MNANTIDVVERLRLRTRPVMAGAGLYEYEVNREPDTLCHEAADTIERLRAELAAKWQPIETAPRDGTVIDLWLQWSDGQGERVPNGFWSEDGFDFGPGRCDGMPGWAAENMGYDGCQGYADDPDDGDHITHWMPVPQSPMIAAAEGGE